MDRNPKSDAELLVEMELDRCDVGLAGEIRQDLLCRAREIGHAIEDHVRKMAGPAEDAGGPADLTAPPGSPGRG